MASARPPSTSSSWGWASRSNYDGVLGAFRILTEPDGLGLSRRRITLSTSGLVPEIERLSREPSRPRLAVSLNATTDAVRERGRVTLCLSSQIGCALDCDFCLTAKMGLVRHLDPGEIVAQAQGLMGEDGAVAIEGLLQSAAEPTTGAVATLVSVVLLAWPVAGKLS